MGPGGAGQKIPSLGKGGACYRHEEQLFSSVGALLLSALRADGARGFPGRQLAMELEALRRMVSPAVRRQLRVSRHADVARPEEHPNRHYRSGLCLFGGSYF